MRCSPGFECQSGAEAMGADAQVCSVHGKKRGASNLMDDGNGGFCCQPGFECQVGVGGPGGQKKYKICSFRLAAVEVVLARLPTAKPKLERMPISMRSQME